MPHIEVLFQIDVIEDGDEKAVVAKWDVAPDEQKSWPANRDARIYFDQKESQ